jgi:hypothetical protein
MSHVFTPAKSKLLSADLDLNAHDIRLMLLKVAASTTADTDVDAATLSAITTLGEIVATSYARQALANEAVNTDTANDRGEFDSDDVAFGALGGATNDTIGALLLYRHVDGTAANDIPIAYIDGAIFPGGASSMTTNGSTVSVTVNAEGWLQAT